jgi:hypothetical protein
VSFLAADEDKTSLQKICPRIQDLNNCSTQLSCAVLEMVQLPVAAEIIMKNSGQEFFGLSGLQRKMGRPRSDPR